MARYYFSCPKIYFGEEAITSLCQFNNKRVGIVTDDFMMSSGKTRYLISHMPEASVCIFGEVTPDPDIDILTSGAARLKPLSPTLLSPSAAARRWTLRKELKSHWKSILEIIKSISLLFPQPADPALK